MATIVQQSINKSNYGIDQSAWLLQIGINSQELLGTGTSNGLFHHQSLQGLKRLIFWKVLNNYSSNLHFCFVGHNETLLTVA